jgi:hypothetical protein
VRSPWLRLLKSSKTEDGGPKPPTAADVALVFTPIVLLQHLIADPVGPGGKRCDGFN